MGDFIIGFMCLSLAIVATAATLTQMMVNTCLTSGDMVIIDGVQYVCVSEDRVSYD